MSCPGKATMYCGEYMGSPEMVCGGRAPGHRYSVVHRVLPDAAAAGPCATSCAKKTDGQVSIRCVHGNVVSHALANVSMKIGGQDIYVGVSRDITQSSSSCAAKD